MNGAILKQLELIYLLQDAILVVTLTQITICLAPDESHGTSIYWPFFEQSRAQLSTGGSLHFVTRNSDAYLRLSFLEKYFTGVENLTSSLRPHHFSETPNVAISSLTHLHRWRSKWRINVGHHTFIVLHLTAGLFTKLHWNTGTRRVFIVNNLLVIQLVLSYIQLVKHKLVRGHTINDRL